MKVIDYDGIDSDIHRRIHGSDAPSGTGTRPSYCRDSAAAHALVDLINKSGQFRVNLTRVVGKAHQAEDWQCEILTADGVDNLATEYDPTEGLAICRAIAHADLRLKSE